MNWYINKNIIKSEPLNDLKSFIPNFYISFRDVHEKCLSIDIPNDLQDKISVFELLFNNSIFPGGTRPRNDKFGVKIHYPNQLLTSKVAKYSWKKYTPEEHYSMKFSLQNIVVLNRRDKRNTPCNTDWKNDDQVIMRNIMKKVGCRPPHWDKMIDLPKCSAKEQIKQFYELNLTGQYPPCKHIQKVLYTYEELNYIEYNLLEPSENSNDIYFNVVILFEDSSFMEIKHVRAFDIQSLIGNSGGYLGLFTGYALLQLPSLVVLMAKWIYKTFSRSQTIHPTNVEANMSRFSMRSISLE